MLATLLLYPGYIVLTLLHCSRLLVTLSLTLLHCDDSVAVAWLECSCTVTAGFAKGTALSLPPGVGFYGSINDAT